MNTETLTLLLMQQRQEKTETKWHDFPAFTVSLVTSSLTTAWPKKIVRKVETPFFIRNLSMRVQTRNISRESHVNVFAVLAFLSHILVSVTSSLPWINETSVGKTDCTPLRFLDRLSYLKSGKRPWSFMFGKLWIKLRSWSWVILGLIFSHDPWHI
jgi:hypothetical protein